MKINNDNRGVVILGSIIIFSILWVAAHYLIGAYHISISDIIQFLREYADIIAVVIMTSILCFAFYRIGVFLDD